MNNLCVTLENNILPSFIIRSLSIHDVFNILQVTVKPDEDFVGFNKTSIIKVNGKLDTSFRSIFDAELDNVESINVKADLGELSISEVDSQSLMDALHGRFVKHQPACQS